MDRPDATSVRAMSKVNFDNLGYSDDDDLQVVVDQANAYIEWVSGRFLDANMPISLVRIAAQAVRMRTEQIVFQSQEDYIETATDDAVSSFSAGSYSETRRDPPQKRLWLNSWTALNELLWMLCTDGRFDYWTEILTGINAPAFDITEVAWSQYGTFSSDVPWLVEPRFARGPDEVINLDAWSW